MPIRKIKIAVGLSGGVDSSVAAALLQEQGHEVIGIIMEIFDGSVGIEESGKHACYGPGEKEDVESAAAVCHTLGIPFHVIDLKKEYKSHVLEYFRNEYLAGRTPNPCIVCNHKLKFGFLLEKAKKIGLDFKMFATGHYAQITKSGERFLLKRALDLSKDQTYFLYALTQKQISQTIFPLGAYTKQQVRQIAGSLGLETSIRPESQDFIAGGDYSPLFNREEIEEGDIVDEKGNIIGKHRGIIHYTVGQRKGLGIASDSPLYVIRIDAPNNRVIVSDRKNLFSGGLIAKDLNLIAVKTLDMPHDVQVKIRINHNAADATLFPHERSNARLLFKEPQMALTPGQSAVFYSGDTVLGGGVIEKAL
jgi:tRNA-specific 2-thiouridylase